MDKIEIFGKDIPLRTHYCQLFNKERTKVWSPYINLYVRFKGCNAKCEFCEFYDNANKFNHDKYEMILKEISEKIRINKVNFTGGEPTINYEQFKKAWNVTKNYTSPHTFYTINTNGLNLERLVDDEEIMERVGNISLSRHHYDDEKNNEIFKTTTPTKEIITKCQSKIENKNTLNLTCNMIKGYIDSEKDIFKYLDFANDMGITYLGLVSLMPINDFCTKEFVDVNNFDLENERITKTKHWTNCSFCECFNYLYIPEKFSNVIKIYHKNVTNPSAENSQSMLVFDGENLQIGFGGEIIV